MLRAMIAPLNCAGLWYSTALPSRSGARMVPLKMLVDLLISTFVVCVPAVGKLKITWLAVRPPVSRTSLCENRKLPSTLMTK